MKLKLATLLAVFLFSQTALADEYKVYSSVIATYNDKQISLPPNKTSVVDGVPIKVTYTDGWTIVSIKNATSVISTYVHCNPLKQFDSDKNVITYAINDVNHITIISGCKTL